MWRAVEVNGDLVDLESIVDQDRVVGVRLLGPGEYSGHFHGDLGDEFRWCIPNVVNSVALEGVCLERPEDLQGPAFWALWHVEKVGV